MYVIKVTNFAGDVLFVRGTAYTGRLNFTVGLRSRAKKFKTRLLANNAIKDFNPSVGGTRFEVIEIPSR